MQRPRRANGRLRKVRTHRKYACRWETVRIGRKMMQGVGGIAMAQSLATADAAPAPRKWPIEEGPDTPKICLSMGDGGGPLPASLQPPAPAAAAPGAAAGRGGRGGGGGYG